MGADRRKHAVQVTSEKAFLLFFSKRDFRERLILPYPTISKYLKNECKLRGQFYEKREEDINDFKSSQQ